MSTSYIEEHASREQMLDNQKTKNGQNRESSRSNQSLTSSTARNRLWSVSFLGFLLIYGDILFDGMTILQFIQDKDEIIHRYNRSDSVDNCERYFPGYQFSYLALAVTELFLLSFISVLSNIKNLQIAAQVFILLEELGQTIIIIVHKNRCLCIKDSSGHSLIENVLEQWTLIIGSILGSVGPVLMYLGNRYKSRAARRISGWNLKGCWFNVIDVLVMLVSVLCSIAIVLSFFCL